MKRRNIAILTLSFILAAGSVTAQTTADSIRLQEYLPIQHTDPLKWVTRYQEEVDKHQEANKQLEDYSCDVLFLGSSSINLWENIYNDLAPLKIIRRSYGGAAIRDILYNYNIIARGFRPRSIAIYVENDICGAPEDVSMGQQFDLFRVLINRLKRNYPNIPIVLLSLKPSPARSELTLRHTIVNTLLREYALETPDVSFIDVASCLYKSDGELRQDIFKSDNLHMNQTGYDLWKEILRPYLQSILR